MIFNEVMALIMPSMIALLFYSKVITRKLTLFEVLGYSSLLMLTTNSVGYAILVYIRKITFLEFSPGFTMKYSIMATFIALIIVIIFRFLELNLNIKLKVESTDEKK